MTAPQAAALLKGWDQILILTHRRPDGDTIGCAIALCQTLRHIGKTAFVLPNPDATSLFDPYWGDTLAPAGFVPGAVVSVDMASLGLLPENALAYRDRIDLAIDHHPSNEGFGRANCVQSDRAACGEILYQVCLSLLGLRAGLPRDVALPLYLAVSTDTGCFVYPNTTSNTHAVAAALMETGIDCAGVNKRHFRTKTYTRMRLESHLAETLELHDGGQTALAVLSLSDKARLDLSPSDLENIAAFAGQLEGVLTAVTIQEMKPGECRLNVRTSGGLNASRICALLGGGGHDAAAGCTVPGTVEEAKAAILKAIGQVRQDG